VAHVPPIHENNKAEHYMDETQLEELLAVLYTGEDRVVCLITLFLLSTGCRLNEVLSAKWSDVDLEEEVFTVRASNSKSKRLCVVPLSNSAIEVLSQLETQGKFEYLFINHKTGKVYTTISKEWMRLCKEVGLPHLRLHDLRHQYASFLVSGGRALYELRRKLGHSDPKVAMRHAHLSTKVLRDAVNLGYVRIRGAI